MVSIYSELQKYRGKSQGREVHTMDAPSFDLDEPDIENYMVYTHQHGDTIVLDSGSTHTILTKDYMFNFKTRNEPWE